MIWGTNNARATVEGEGAGGRKPGGRKVHLFRASKSLRLSPFFTCKMQ